MGKNITDISNVQKRKRPQSSGDKAAQRTKRTDSMDLICPSEGRVEKYVKKEVERMEFLLAFAERAEEAVMEVAMRAGVFGLIVSPQSVKDFFSRTYEELFQNTGGRRQQDGNMEDDFLESLSDQTILGPAYYAKGIDGCMYEATTYIELKRLKANVMLLRVKENGVSEVYSFVDSAGWEELEGSTDEQGDDVETFPGFLYMDIMYRYVKLTEAQGNILKSDQPLADMLMKCIQCFGYLTNAEFQEIMKREDFQKILSLYRHTYQFMDFKIIGTPLVYSIPCVNPEGGIQEKMRNSYPQLVPADEHRDGFCVTFYAGKYHLYQSAGEDAILYFVRKEFIKEPEEELIVLRHVGSTENNLEMAESLKGMAEKHTKEPVLCLPLSLNYYMELADMNPDWKYIHAVTGRPIPEGFRFDAVTEKVRQDTFRQIQQIQQAMQ